MIVVHIVTTAAASGSVKQDKAMANCDCKWASANSCAPHSNDDSRCWVVCCSGEEARRRAAVNSAWTNRAPHEREGRKWACCNEVIIPTLACNRQARFRLQLTVSLRHTYLITAPVLLSSPSLALAWPA